MAVRTKFGVPRYRSRLRIFHGWPELTAAVDIAFLIILFLVSISSVVRVSGINVDLPRVAPPHVADIGRFVITITPPVENGRSCQIYFQDRLMKFENLRQELSKLRDRKINSVIIRSDRKVPWIVVAEVIAVVEGENLKSFIALVAPDARPEARFE